MQLLEIVKSLWWLLVTVLGVMGYIVGLHLKVNSSEQAVHKLFTMIENLQEFKTRQEVVCMTEIQTRKEIMRRLEILVSELNVNLEEKFARIDSRIDSIFEALRKLD